LRNCVSVNALYTSTPGWLSDVILSIDIIRDFKSEKVKG
jgi:hypothetical protein